MRAPINVAQRGGGCVIVCVALGACMFVYCVFVCCVVVYVWFVLGACGNPVKCENGYKWEPYSILCYNIIIDDNKTPGPSIQGGFR